MYALVEILGKQYKASEGAILKVDLVKEEKRDNMEFASVLAISNNGDVTFGTPYVKGAKVECSFVEDIKGEKIKVYKFSKRKGYRRTQGHRQKYSLVKVNKIVGVK